MTLNEYLLLRFNRSNHPKYRKYATKWINNLTIEQLSYFRKEMFKSLLIWKKSILVVIVYIIIFAMEILVYYISKDSAIYFYGLITLIAFILNFSGTLDEW